MSARTVQMTDDILRDLVSLYLAKEASGDTTTLVESCLKENPSLAQEVARASRLLTPAPAAATREPDLHALIRTQRLLYRRSVCMGLGIFCALLPFSFVANDSGFHFLFLEHGPAPAILSWLAAVVFWVGFFTAQGKLRVAGF